MRHPLTWMALLVMTAALATAAPAAADPPVVAVEGEGAVTEAVRAALADHCRLVAATEPGLEAIVTVKVTGTRKKATATVSARQAYDAKDLGAFVVEGKRSRLARLTARRVWRELGEALESAEPRPAPMPRPTAVAAAQ